MIESVQSNKVHVKALELDGHTDTKELVFELEDMISGSLSKKSSPNPNNIEALVKVNVNEMQTSNAGICMQKSGYTSTKLQLSQIATIHVWNLMLMKLRIQSKRV